jgi:hypothetical protein
MFLPTNTHSLRGPWFKLFRAGAHLLTLFTFFTRLTQPRRPVPFLLQWLREQPPERRILMVVDSASGELISVEAVEQKELPAVLCIALGDSAESGWQYIGRHHLIRRNFEPAKLLSRRMDALVELEAIVSCRLAALAEMTVIDQETLKELEKLGVYFEHEVGPPRPKGARAKKYHPQ